MSSDERKFLHDVANPVGTALFVADTLLEILKSEPAIASNTELVQLTGEILLALEKSRDMIQKRREELMIRSAG